ncbi:hypothetical protein LWI29_020537 [Acer saccharum]|uniref:Uncharacterized protein n=1 Tax=Acer saccharum TaxID=4024 RepID=A0AA39TBJ0_ACESA|nr:hypothetical protein LWI29_020537 [Acer saccharum]
MALLLRRFKKFIKFENKGFGSKGQDLKKKAPFKSFEPRQEHSEKKGVQCYECGGIGHISPDCGKLKNKMAKVMATTWSESDDSGKGGKSSSDDELTINYTAFGATCVEDKVVGKNALTSDPIEERDEEVAIEKIGVATHWDMALINSRDQGEGLNEGNDSGFYWPTLFADAKRVAARCEACQKIANNIRQPPELLQSITSPWPFAMWGIDLIDPMPTATGGAKHAIVAVDYFTKWVEAEPLVHITEANTISFVKKNILYRFGIPNTIITDNGTQFDGRKFRELCDKYGINNYYASPAHPQMNGQTEAVNKIIKHNLKAKLATKKRSWADKLPQVLWAYRTTEWGSTGETPYSMAYGAEAVIPVETSFSSPRVQLFQPELNIDMLKCGLDELEERRESAQIRNTAYQQRVARYYNSHVRERRFSLGDLVLKRVNLGTRDKAAGSLADKWEGPYQITGIAGHGAYRITREGFGELPRPCNAQYLKIYYP